MPVFVPEDKLDELVAFVAARMPGYEGRLVPAPADLIEQLEELSGNRLPPLYRAYLARMGENDGGLILGSYDMRARAVIEQHHDHDRQSPPELVLIGVQPEAARLELYVDTRSQPNLVLRMFDESWGDDSYTRRLFYSLGDFMAWHVFQQVCADHRLAHGSLDSLSVPSARAPQLMRQVSDTAQHMGFTEVLTSTSPLIQLFEREDAALYLRFPPELDGSFVGWLCCDTAEELFLLGEIFADRHGVELTRRHV